MLRASIFVGTNLTEKVCLCRVGHTMCVFLDIDDQFCFVGTHNKSWHWIYVTNLPFIKFINCVVAVIQLDLPTPSPPPLPPPPSFPKKSDRSRSWWCIKCDQNATIILEIINKTDSLVNNSSNYVSIVVYSCVV